MLEPIGQREQEWEEPEETPPLLLRLFLSALSSSLSGTLLGFTHRKQRAANFPKIVLFRAQTQECEDKQMAEPSPASLGCDTALKSGSGLAWSVPQLQTQTRRRVEVVAEIKKGVGIAAFPTEVRSNRTTALARVITEL